MHTNFTEEELQFEKEVNNFFKEKYPKDIKEKAFTEVFAKELNQLDGESKEVLDKVVSYLEKKYISVPMKMAREILIKNQQ